MQGGRKYIIIISAWRTDDIMIIYTHVWIMYHLLSRTKKKYFESPSITTIYTFLIVIKKYQQNIIIIIFYMTFIKYYNLIG